MRKILLIAILLTVISIMASSQNKVLLTVGGQTRTATLVDNEATRELMELLYKGSITILMTDYGGFEKVGALPQPLPASNTQITTQPGDIMLYQGNQMVIFYGPNSWSYTRLGKIDDFTESGLKEFLGNGDIYLTLSPDPVSGIDTPTVENADEVIHDLQGNRITGQPLQPGIYIIGGKETLIR